MSKRLWLDVPERQQGLLVIDNNGNPAVIDDELFRRQRALIMTLVDVSTGEMQTMLEGIEDLLGDIADGHNVGRMKFDDSGAPEGETKAAFIESRKLIQECIEA